MYCSDHRIAIKHFRSIHNDLLHQLEKSSTAKHGDISGTAREQFVNDFLVNHLPSLAGFGTGEAFDKNDRRSGQLDIILRSAWAPVLHIKNDSMVTPIDSVIAGIEVKSSLTTAGVDSSSHLQSSLVGSLKLKMLERQKFAPATVALGKTYFSTFKRTPYFIVAYKGPTIETLQEKLLLFPKSKDAQTRHNSYYPGQPMTHDDYLPEAIVVLDQSYCLLRNDGLISTKDENSSDPWIRFLGDDCLAAFFIYLLRMVELWNVSPPSCNFSAYIRPLKNTGNH